MLHHAVKHVGHHRGGSRAAEGKADWRLQGRIKNSRIKCVSLKIDRQVQLRNYPNSVTAQRGDAAQRVTVCKAKIAEGGVHILFAKRFGRRELQVDSRWL